MRLNWLLVSGLCSTLLLGCVSESTIVDSNRQPERKIDNKQVARTRLSLGLNYLQRGETAQARFNLEKAKELAPELPEIANALAYYYQQVGEFDQAEAAYREALRKDSNNPDTYNNFGAFLCQINKFEQAEELLLAAVKRPGYIRVAESYENLALCALSQKDFGKYEQYLQQAIRHNGLKQSIVYAMAVLKYATGDLQQAKVWQQRLQDVGAVSPQVSLLRYIIAYQLKDEAERQKIEKFMLSVYPTAAETAWVLSADFSESEPEKMRRDYKQSLIGSTDDNAQPGSSRHSPKIKVVKRKTGVQPESQAYALTTDNTPQVELAAPAQPAVVAAPASNPSPDTQIAAEAANMPESSHSTAATAEQTQPAQTQPAQTHKVQYGETLYRIASKYRLSVSELQQLNGLRDPADIKAGQLLQLRATATLPEQYLAQDGDTLFSIAYKFGLTLQQLAQWNQLSADAVLTSGQQILLKDPTL